MAHKVESMVRVGSAWHGLGVELDPDDPRKFDVMSMMHLSGLSKWRVELATCLYHFESGGSEFCDVVKGSRVVIRVNDDGTVQPLGTVGTKFRELQNEQAFMWFQPWLDTKEVSIETAGSLECGRSVWVLARILRGNVVVTGGDEIGKFLLLHTRHDGKASTSVGFTPIRVVCDNTLRASFECSESKLLKVRHTEGQHESLSAIRDTIDIIDQQFNATADQYRRLLACGLSPKELRDYVKIVNDVAVDTPEKALSARMRNRIDDMVRLASYGKGQSGELTAWAAYNGVTEYLTHRAGSDAEKRLRSNMDGAYGKMNKRAFDLAMQLAS